MTGILDRGFRLLASMPCARLMAGKLLCVVPSQDGARGFARRLAPECFYVPGRACRRDPDSGIEMPNEGSVVYTRSGEVNYEETSVS